MSLKTFEICAKVNQTVNLNIHNVPDDKIYSVVADTTTVIEADTIKEALDLFFTGDFLYTLHDEYDNLQRQVNITVNGDVFVRDVLSQSEATEILIYEQEREERDTYGDPR